MAKAVDRSFLKRLLVTTALPLALLAAGSVGTHAAVVVVVGANGANGANGVNFGDPGQPGGDGQPATADAGHLVPNSDATKEGPK